MRHYPLRLLPIAATAVLLLGLVAQGPVSAQSADLTYLVTIENLTSGQPFAPPAVVAHDGATHVFTVGDAAGPGVRAIAETGDPSVLLGEVDGAAGVYDATALGGPVLPGASASALVSAPAGSNLSAVMMLICTNDGFTGIDAMELPQSGSVTVETGAYDAGSETNTEESTDIVDPCGMAGPVALPADGDGHTDEDGVIGMHAGIEGTADLDADEHGWTDPVARITVEVVETVTFTVSLENLTGGQPFSPPIVIAHTAGTSFFTIGEAASEQLQAIAEMGDAAPMAALAAGSPDVYSYAVFGGPLLPGTTASIDIDAPADAELTVAAMLICTNDGFTGVSGAGLDGAPLSIDADAYDAGSEMNTEVSTDIVDPCGEAGPVAFPADGDANPEEDDVIQMHPGITGDGDLEPGEHGWSGPVLAIGVNQAEEPTPTPTATATPTEVPATATATPTSSPTPVPATATPTRAAPEPPETGSGLSGAGGGSDQLWLLVTASAIIVAGAAVASLTLRRRSAR